MGQMTVERPFSLKVSSQDGKVVVESEELDVSACGNSLEEAVETFLTNLKALALERVVDVVSVKDRVETRLSERNVTFNMKHLRLVAKYYGIPVEAFFVPLNKLRRFEKKEVNTEALKAIEKLEKIRKILQE